MYTVATTISTICGNYFTQHIPLHIPRRSLNKPKPILTHVTSVTSQNNFIISIGISYS